MKSIIRAVLEERRLMGVRPLVVVMPKLVMNGGKVFCRDLNAHLQPDILLIVDVPSACMADHISIMRLHKQRTLPECVWQLSETERLKKRFAVVDHLLWISLAFL